MYTKKNGGKMIRRIGDNERECEELGVLEKTYNSMALAGLHCDEGSDMGGGYALYIQRVARMPIYTLSCSWWKLLTSVA